MKILCTTLFILTLIFTATAVWIAFGGWGIVTWVMLSISPWVAMVLWTESKS